MNDNESTIVESTSAVEIFLKPKLKKGYYDVNLVNISEYYNSNKSLNDYLKDLILSEISTDDETYEFVEEIEEFRPTNYILNPRSERTIFVENVNKKIKTAFAVDFKL